MSSNFGTALRHIKNGSRVTREKWTENSIFWILYFSEDRIMVDSIEALKWEWIPSQEDILASDWYITF